MGDRWTPGSNLQGRDFAGGRAELIAGERGRSLSPASRGGDSSPAADGRRAGQGISPHVRWRRHEVRECGRRGLALGIEEGSARVFVGLGRIEWADTYRPTYSIFTKLTKIWILFRYVSITYPTRIRIGYVSDTGYDTSLAYPCYIGTTDSLPSFF